MITALDAAIEELLRAAHGPSEDMRASSQAIATAAAAALDEARRADDAAAVALLAPVAELAAESDRALTAALADEAFGDEAVDRHRELLAAIVEVGRLFLGRVRFRGS